MRITEKILPHFSKRAGAHNTETKVVVAVVRVVVVPVTNRRVVGVVIPRAAAFDAVRAGSGTAP